MKTITKVITITYDDSDPQTLNEEVISHNMSVAILGMAGKMEMPNVVIKDASDTPSSDADLLWATRYAALKGEISYLKEDVDRCRQELASLKDQQEKEKRELLKSFHVRANQNGWMYGVMGCWSRTWAGRDGIGSETKSTEQLYDLFIKQTKQ